MRERERKEIFGEVLPGTVAVDLREILLWANRLGRLMEATYSAQERATPAASGGVLLLALHLGIQEFDGDRVRLLSHVADMLDAMERARELSGAQE